MNKSLLQFGIFISILATIIGLIQSISNLVIGNAAFFFDSFQAWFIILNIVTLAFGVMLLYYFYQKNFKLAFWIEALAIPVVIFHSSAFYFLLLNNNGISTAYYLATFLMLAVNPLMGLVFILSETKKVLLLKILGFFILFAGTFLLIASLYSLGITDIQTLNLIEKSMNWIGIVLSFMPLVFAYLFQNETKNLQPRLTASWKNALGIFSFFLLLGVMTIGLPHAFAAYNHVYWQGKNSEMTQNLVHLAEQHVFIGSNNDTIHYLLIKPLDVKPDKKYPLFVALPYGEFNAPPALFLTEEANRLKYPAYIMVPFCPQGKGWGGVAGSENLDEAMFEAIESLDGNGTIDLERRYVAGVSRGGYGAWNFIQKRPDLFAAAIPVCGEGDASMALSASKVAVWAFHGSKDRNVPVEGSREMIEAIKLAGASPHYTEYSNEGHNIWHLVQKEAGLWNWLFSQEKSDGLSLAQ